MDRNDALLESCKLLRNANCFLFDMDGTIYLGDKLIPGAKELIQHLASLKVPFYFLTNNSSRSREHYIEKLDRIGLTIPPERIFSSGEATALYIKRNFPDSKVYLVGTVSLAGEFQRHAIDLVQSSPNLVVLGFDTTLTYEKLRRLCDFVFAGLPYIATHPDINCPTEDGFMPDIGAMMAFIETSTGRKPDIIIGKPYPPIVEAIVEKTGFSVGEMVMVGDRLYTDIALSQAGISTILVLSGESSREDVDFSPFKPDLIIQDVGELLELIKMVK